MNRFLFCLFSFLTVLKSYSQPGSENKNALESPMIEDNSFLLEEAYNQETSVVQFIQNCYFGKINMPDWSYGFTNEIPMNGAKHQFSYSINYIIC